jgi:hypothetical protein
VTSVSKPLSSPDLQARLLAAIAIAAASAAMVSLYYVRHPHLQSDFDPLWFATRALLSGDDPYGAVADLGWPWPLYYPLPALLLVIPFVALPMELARAAFVALSTGALAFVVTKRAFWPLLVVPTAAFVHAITYAQWSPLLTVAVLIPLLGGILVLKPSTGLVLFLTRPTWRAALGSIALVVLSFVIQPSWFWAWRDSVRAVTHLPALLRPGGFLLLLAVLRWRRPEARLVALLALIPVRPVYYETLPLLLLVPHSLRQALILVIGVNIAFLVNSTMPLAPTVDLMDAAAWTPLLAFLYIPCLIMVLFRANRSDPFALIEGPSPTPSQPPAATTGDPEHNRDAQS